MTLHKPMNMANTESKERIVKKVSLLLGICLALLLVVAGCSSGDTGSAVKIDAKVGISSIAALTEAHVEGLASSMEIMALTDEVRSCDWDTMKGLLSEFEQNGIPLLAWFALPDGSYYTVDTGKASGNLSDRPYFPKVMSGEVAIGDLVMSKSTSKASMIIAVPVKENGEVVGALGASVYLNELSQSITKDLGLPNDVAYSAVNKDGMVALNSNVNLIMGNASTSDQAVSTHSTLLGWTFYLDMAK
jgi:hypothetical protein